MTHSSSPDPITTIDPTELENITGGTGGAGETKGPGTNPPVSGGEGGTSGTGKPHEPTWQDRVKRVVNDVIG